MTEEDFRKMVEDIGFSPVPLKFRDKVRNVAILIEDEPDESTCRDMGLSPDETLLGLYQGIPHTERGEGYGFPNMPDKITLYRLPILEAAEEDGIPIRQVVEETIWHEVAHHFGLDEDEVRDRESRRKDH